MKINLQINKTMIKMNKQRYFDVSLGIVEGPGVSWGVLGCPGVIIPTHVHPVNGTGFYVVHFGLLRSIRFLSRPHL